MERERERDGWAIGEKRWTIGRDGGSRENDNCFWSQIIEILKPKLLRKKNFERKISKEIINKYIVFLTRNNFF